MKRARLMVGVAFAAIAWWQGAALGIAAEPQKKLHLMYLVTAKADDLEPGSVVAVEPAFFTDGREIVFAGVSRLPTGRFKFSFEAVDVPRTGVLDTDVDAIVSAYTNVLEKHVRKVPEQYLWQHRRWKHLPPPERIAPRVARHAAPDTPDRGSEAP